MQVTKCVPSKTHVAVGESFDLSITVKMGSAETLPSSGNGSYISFTGYANNQYEYEDGMLIMGLPLRLERDDGGFLEAENPGIGKGASKTFTFQGVYIPADYWTEYGKNALTDGGAARAYPYAMAADGSNYVAGADYYGQPLASVGTFLLSRLDPVIDDVAFTDLHALDPRTHFGAYVQGQSLPRIAGSVTLDPLDTTLTAVHALTLTCGGATIYEAASDSGVFEPGAPDVSGTVDWRYTVTDSAGNYTVRTGSFAVLPYAPPVLDSAGVERYKAVTADDGTVSYVAADDGESVRFTLAGGVSSVAGLNAWTLKISYGVAGEDAATTVTALSGADGQTFQTTDDRTLVTAAIPASTGYDFAVELSDYFGSVRRVVSVYKAGAYFYVGKNGVGVGMRPTSTADNPKFQCAWPAEFFAGGGGNDQADYSTDEADTGSKWIDGKKIYRKVVEFSGSSSSGAVITVQLNTGPIDTPVNLLVRCRSAINSSEWHVMPHASTSLGYMRELILFSTDSAPYVRLKAGSSLKLGQGFIVVEYTKPDET